MSKISFEEKMEFWLTGIQYDISVIYKVCCQRGAELNYYPLNYLQQIFYLVKTLICYTLGRFHYEIVLKENQLVNHCYLPEEHIIMAFLDGGTSFDGEYNHSWVEELIVGRGVFNNWWVEFYEDI